MTDCRVRLGISMPLGSAADAVELTRYAREHGCEEAWLAEVNGGDAYVLAGALAASLPGMPLGVAVSPAQTRTPLVHAMAGMTLAQLTGGHFSMGLGISSPNIVRDWAGQPFDKPLLRMREHITAIRSLLSGEKTNFQGETLSVTKARLAGPIPGPVPICVGALNRNMLRLCGELGDGVILNMVPEHGLRKVTQAVREGAEAVGRDASPLQVVSRLHVVMTDDEKGGRDLVRAVFGPYAATPGYNRFFRWVGFEEQAQRIADCFAKGDREGLSKAVTDDLCDAIAIVGSAEKVRSRLRAYAEAGVDVCVINPIGNVEQVRNTLSKLSGCLDDIQVKEHGVMRGSRVG